MSSIATAIPQAPVPTDLTWCIKNWISIWGPDGPNAEPYEYNECLNSTKGQKKSDFQTICCDGEIIDTSGDIWNFEFDREAAGWTFDIDNFVCCREGGQLLPGGIKPIDTHWERCDAGQLPTPLASLAATNTENAALYVRTYGGAKGVSTEWGDWTATGSPSCMWIETKYPGVKMSSVTVPAAGITTLPTPTIGEWGNTIISTPTGEGNAPARSTSSSTESGTTISEDATAATPTSRTSSLSINGATLIALLGLFLGLVVIGAL